MWLVFLLMMMSILIGLLFIVWIANKVMIAMQKDNDEYAREKEREDEINER